MITEFFRAFLMAGVPVGVVSYLLIWWALRGEYFEHTTKLKQLKKEVKQLSKARKKNKKGTANSDNTAGETKVSPIHGKWLKFGGGFYGTIALMTFAIVEVGEILAFFTQFSEIMGKLSNFHFGMIVDFFVESIMNFVTAIAWPWYWMEEIETGEFWIWLLAAYGGYWLGAKAAMVLRKPAEPEN